MHRRLIDNARDRGVFGGHRRQSHITRRISSFCFDRFFWYAHLRLSGFHDRFVVGHHVHGSRLRGSSVSCKIDRTRKRVRPGASFRMSFVVDDRQMQYDIVIPDAAPDTLTLLSAAKGVICDILHLIYGLQTAYLQHKSTIFSKVFNSAIYRIV